LAESTRGQVEVTGQQTDGKLPELGSPTPLEEDREEAKSTKSQ
jgi:hypothetical protein